MQYTALNVLNFACKGCRFAEFESDEQTGCAAGRLDVLRDRPGVSIEQVMDPPEFPLPHQKFFAVDGSFCLWRRIAPWEGTVEAARQELLANTTVHLIVHLNGGTLEDLRATVGEARDYAVVTVIPGRGSAVKRGDLRAYLDSLGRRWTIEDPLSEDVTTGQVVDDAVQSTKSLFYVETTAGVDLPADLVGKIRSAVIDCDKQFIMLRGEGYRVVQTKGHKHFGGNALSEITDGPRQGETLCSIEEKLLYVDSQEGMGLVVDAREVLL